MPIDWGSELWREVGRLADEGDKDSQRLIYRLRDEEKAAPKTAQAGS